MRIGDQIEDLERPGAVGVITAIIDESPRPVVTYYMLAPQCTPDWQDAIQRMGAEDWNTGLWRVTLSKNVEEAAIYYDAVTQ